MESAIVTVEQYAPALKNKVPRTDMNATPLALRNMCFTDAGTFCAAVTAGAADHCVMR